MKLCIELTKKQLKDLKVLIDVCFDMLSFDGDFADMEEPLDILAMAVKEEIEK